MSDKEIADIIATKVMGWHKGEATFMRSEFRFHEVTEEAWLHQNGCLGAVSEWNPLKRDNDCMMAWDKFSEKHYAELTRLGGEDWEADNGTSIIYNSDRRRAMCECMVRAVVDD